MEDNMRMVPVPEDAQVLIIQAGADAEVIKANPQISEEK